MTEPEPRYEHATLVGGEQMIAHAAEGCLVQPCAIHAPSSHHMADWPQHWQGDRGIIERICEHGIGHPDPDGIFDPGSGVHGCDGCCWFDPANRPDDQGRS